MPSFKLFPSCRPARRAQRAQRARWAALAIATLWLGVGCGGSIDARLAEVQALHDASDFSSSIEPLRSILASDPNHPRANYLLGVALVQTRQPSLAVWPLRKATQDEEFTVPAGLLLASTLSQMDGHEEAVKVIDQVLGAEPDSIIALQMRAKSNVASGALEEALADAEHVLELEPDGYQGIALKAMALTQLERVDEAEKTLIQLNEVAEASGDPAISMQSCVGLAVFYRDAEFPQEKTDAAFRDCITRYPGQAFVLKEADSYLHGQGRADEALALWREAVAEAPDDLGLRLILANRLQGQQKNEEAEQVLTEAAELFQEAGAWTALADFHRSRGDFEKARAATDKAIAASPGEPDELLFQKADLLVMEGEVEAAERIAPQLGQVVYRELIRARVLMARGQDVEALEVLESALTRWPNNAGARFLAGTLAEKLGDTEKALSHYREASRAEADATDAALSVAGIMLASGSYAEAETWARRHQENRETRVAETHVVLARASAAQGRYPQASRLLRRVIEEDPATGFVELAAVERQAEGPEKAASVVEDSGLDLADPANRSALEALVGDYTTMGRRDAAMARVESALRRSPNAPELLDLQGRVHFRAGELPEARAAFEAALAASPGYAPAQTGLASTAVAEGDLDGALRILNEAESLDADGQYLAAQILISRGDSAGAEARLRALLEKHPEQVLAGNDLAWLLAEQGRDLDLALRLAERAARVEPRPEVLDTLGWVQYKRGDAAAAEATFRRALEAEPNAAPVHYRLGLALRDLDRDEEALAAFRVAVGDAAAPESAAARAEIAKLESGR